MRHDANLQEEFGITTRKGWISEINLGNKKKRNVVFTETAGRERGWLKESRGVMK